MGRQLAVARPLAAGDQRLDRRSRVAAGARRAGPGLGGDEAAADVGVERGAGDAEGGGGLARAHGIDGHGLMISINIDAARGRSYRRTMTPLENLTDPDAPDLFPASFPRDGFPR